MRYLSPLCAFEPDATLHNLGTAELLLIASARLWTLQRVDPLAEGELDWQVGLAAAGLDEPSRAAFGALMETIVADFTRPIGIHGLGCPQIGEDEAWLLIVTARLQRGWHQAALASLTHWLPVSAARMALGPARLFADALVQAGLIVPAHCPTAGQLKPTHSSAYANPGLALVQ